jgi:cell division protein FtsB
MHARAARLVVPLALVSALALVAVWFPFSTLLGQSAQLDATTRQIALLHRQSESLDRQRAAMSSKQATTMLAREEYQLVEPGQRIIQVLSGTGAGTGSGDPGDQRLVDPANAAGLLPATPSDPSGAHAARSGFWSRVVRTLEFWR